MCFGTEKDFYHFFRPCKGASLLTLDCPSNYKFKVVKLGPNNSYFPISIASLLLHLSLSGFDNDVDIIFRRVSVAPWCISWIISFFGQDNLTLAEHHCKFVYCFKFNDAAVKEISCVFHTRLHCTWVYYNIMYLFYCEGLGMN